MSGRPTGHVWEAPVTVPGILAVETSMRVAEVKHVDVAVNALAKNSLGIGEAGDTNARPACASATACLRSVTKRGFTTSQIKRNR